MKTVYNFPVLIFFLIFSTITKAQITNDEKLIEAIQSNNFKLVQQIVESGANVNAIVKINNIERSPLYVSINKCNDSITLYLLSKGANIFPSALNLSVCCSSEPVIKELINRGAKVNQYSDGYTPIHMAIMYSDFKIYKLLLDNKADLSQTVRFKELDYYDNYLEKQKWDYSSGHYPPTIPEDLERLFNTQLNKPGIYNPLFLIKKETDSLIIKDLLQKGYSANSKSLDNETPLITALRCKNQKATEILARTVNIAQLDKELEKPLVLYAYDSLSVSILQKKGANINKTWKPGYYTQTALIYAIGKGDYSKIHGLLVNGAMLPENRYDLNMLILNSISGGWSEIEPYIDFLIKNGFSSVNAVGTFTPVTSAIFHHNYKALATLLKYKPNLFLKNSDQNSFEFAIKERDTLAYSMLIKCLDPQKQIEVNSQSIAYALVRTWRDKMTNFEIVEYLLSLPYNKNYKDENGNNLLIKSIDYEEGKLIGFFVKENPKSMFENNNEGENFCMLKSYNEILPLITDTAIMKYADTTAWATCREMALLNNDSTTFYKLISINPLKKKDYAYYTYYILNNNIQSFIKSWSKTLKAKGYTDPLLYMFCINLDLGTELKAILTTQTPKKKINELFEIALNTNKEKCLNVLVAYKPDINRIDAQGKTWGYRLMKNGKIEEARKLRNAGSYIFIKADRDQDSIAFDLVTSVNNINNSYNSWKTSTMNNPSSDSRLNAANDNLDLARWRMMNIDIALLFKYYAQLVNNKGTESLQDEVSSLMQRSKKASYAYDGDFQNSKSLADDIVKLIKQNAPKTITTIIENETIKSN